MPGPARYPRKKKVDAASIVRGALDQLKRGALNECFTASNLESRPTPAQMDILRGIQDHLIRYVIAGNQCKPGYSLVMTPQGPRRLDSLVVGDTVYDENGLEQKVVRTWNNGPKEIGDLTSRGRTLSACTAEHKWWTNTYSRTDGELLVTKKVAASAFGKEDAVARTWVRAPLGDVDNPHAYALGAFLGDGCSRQAGRQLYISSSDCGVPEKVATILGGTATKNNGENYTWVVRASSCTHYDEWCRGRYAHEKTVDMDVIRSWNRRSLLNFVAGLLDTDGSVYKAKDHVTLFLGMQALPVIEAFEYAVLALWNVQLSRSVDARSKYKNGPLYGAYTRNVHEIKRILQELDEYTVKPTRKWQAEYDALGGRRSRADASRLTWGSNRRIEPTYDITVSGANNVYMLANGLVTSNSGKSDTAVRELVWLLEDSHPFFVRPTEWGEPGTPLMFLVVGQDRNQLDVNFWQTRIRPFLAADEWREHRSSGSLMSVSHKTKGHQIVFLSHGHSSEDDIKHMQSYSAHWVWVDEMPSKIRVLEELQRRVDAKRGRFICSFTMKYRNDAIRKLIDASDGRVARKYQLNKLDNPIYADRKQEELDKLAALPPELRAAILTGAWLTSTTHVYSIDPEKHLGRPAGYNPSWRHVAVADPATESKLGLTVWAEQPIQQQTQPGDGTWWCVIDQYVEGVGAPSLIVQKVEEFLRPLNVVKRVYDNEAAWFAHQARETASVTWIPVTNKSYRKQFFISQFIEALGTRIRIAEWCTRLIAEIETCERNPETDQIANRSRFHLIDTGHYLVECLPKPEFTTTYSSFHGFLIAQDDKRIATEAKEKKLKLLKQLRGRVARNPPKQKRRSRGWVTR